MSTCESNWFCAHTRKGSQEF